MKTKKFIYLQIGDIVQIADGRHTAEILSLPGRGVIRHMYGVVMQIAGEEELTWSEMRPGDDVFLA